MMDCIDLSTPDVEEKINESLRLLSEKEEHLDKQLEALSARKSYLETKIRGITKALPNLQIVHSDSEQLSEMISFTCTLAENVSAKVRQLDVARSRVSECQQRVHDLLDVQLCSDGVQTALSSDDYEKAAAHVHRFLTMDQSLLQQTADDVQQDCSAVTNSLSLLQEAAGQLRDIVTIKFTEAVRKSDAASVERFFKIFPLINMHDYGLEKYSAYLAAKLDEASAKSMKSTLETPSNDKRACVVFADMLTVLFETIARLFEIHQPLIETYYGPGRLLKVSSIIQQECDKQSKLILNEFNKQRSMDRKIALINEVERLGNSSSSNALNANRLDPKDIDLLLSEISIMHSRYQLYVRFLQRRISNDLEIGIKDTASRAVHLSDMEALIQNSDLCRRMQTLLGHYLLLERYYMENSVIKAVSIDTIDKGSQTSSMVDDVFFIVRKCIRRAGTSGSIDGVCAVINNACGALETEMCSALRNQLKLGFPSGYLDLTQAYNVMLQGRLQTSDSEQARNTFLIYLNNADVCSECVTTLCRSLSHELPCSSEHERAKLDSCLGGLSVVTAALGAIVDYGLQQLQVSAIKPRIGPWVDTFFTLSHNLTQEEFSNYEANEPFVRNLIANLNMLLLEFEKVLTSSNYDALIAILVSEVTTQMEKVIMKSEFNRLGGLALDKEVRSLVTYLSNATSWSVRDKFARLTQIATVLNLEKVSEISDYWGQDSTSIPWRLTPGEVRKIMTLRTDFRNEEIRRLKF
ncbi:conserved oligomeric Golgi complex subunit 4-like [Nilaparvata lugens]|uniref:conserved oligomeric Golgi complex subunit 4-like n=2 Tax=Nilaparvata lugens TaxID=108931 RepID=UPI000B985EAD|nr:conserved oligomeric Golgi complex subunit 4-like [Nilaparvata lugens]